MGSDDEIPRNIIRIDFKHRQHDKSKPDMDSDADMLAWLHVFISDMLDGPIDLRTFHLTEDHSDPTEMQELEYLDSTVTGDEHPDTLQMIMDAYKKHSGR